MNTLSIKNQTKLSFKLYFENNNSEFCISQDFKSEKKSDDSIFDDATHFYNQFSNFLENQLKSSIVSIEITIHSFSDYENLEEFIQKLKEKFVDNLSGYIDFNYSSEVDSFMTDNQRNYFQKLKNENQYLTDFVATLQSFN